MLLKVAGETKLVTTEFTRELLVLQVNNSDVPSSIGLFRGGLVTVQTEPPVAGEFSYRVVDVFWVHSGQLQARTEHRCTAGLNLL